MENKNDDKKFNGLSRRHVAQIIRRKTITKVVPSKKIYKRKNNRKIKDE